MSAVPQSNAAATRDNKRAPNTVYTYSQPYQRQIPVPEFYPTERTSTASFKAPVTMPKKVVEPPPPPPQGTLTNAMNYISSPVKYFSSMFSAPAPVLEAVKPKERQFKVDLEREKEKQTSPKLSASMKKIQNIVVEEVVPQPKLVQQPEKPQVSAWRRRNMMNEIVIPPLSPKPAKFRSQSPSHRRQPVSNTPAADLSPTHVSQLKIASSSNQFSYKVVSKEPPPEPERKKKKDPRKIANGRLAKEPPMTVNFNKSGSKYNPSISSKLNMQSTIKDDYPIVPYPTVLPPRIPPATYTIKSSNMPVPEETNAAKEQEATLDVEQEAPVVATLNSGSTDPALMSHDLPVIGPSFPANLGPGLDQEVKLEETLGMIDGTQVIKVTRLDQLPPGQLGKVGGRGLTKMFPDVTYVADNRENTSTAFGAEREEPLQVVLCASTPRRPSPDNAPVKIADTKKAVETKRPPETYKMVGKDIKPQRHVREPSASPMRKSVSQNLARSESMDNNASMNLTNQSKDVALKGQNREVSRAPYKAEPPKRPNYSYNHTKELSLKTSQGKRSQSSSAQGSARKQSPLRVEDKHIAALEESVGKDHRRSRISMKLSDRDNSASNEHLKTSVAPATKPRIIKRMTTNSKESSSPEKTAASSTINAAAVAAVATAAATAVTSVIQHAKSEPEKISRDVEPVIKPVPPRSPPSSWKFEKEGMARVRTPSPKQDMTKLQEDLVSHKSADNPPAGNPKIRSPSAFKDFVKTNLLPQSKEAKSNKPAVNTVNMDSDKEVCTAEDCEEFNCMDNYCGDPSRFFKAATMMGEMP